MHMPTHSHTVLHIHTYTYTHTQTLTLRHIHSQTHTHTLIHILVGKAIDFVGAGEGTRYLIKKMSSKYIK